MFEHQQIWNAIDRLAESHGLSPSGLARRAGLDPTTFNKSKRFARDGRARWPSTESISKILTVTGVDYEVFYSFSRPRDSQRPGRFEKGNRIVPVLGMAQAGMGGFFDDGGFPAGQGWEEVELPVVTQDGDYALRISGDSMLPVYRNGDIVVVSLAKAPIPGDRVVVKTVDGEVMAKVLLARNDDSMTLMSFNPAHPARKIPLEAVEWMVRITWASQ